MTRWISGFVLAVIVVSFLLLVHPFVVQIAVIALSLIGAYEFYSMTLKHTSRPHWLSGCVLAGLGIASFVLWQRSFENLFMILAAQLILSFLIFFRNSADFKERVQDLSFYYLGLMYVTLLF